MMKNFKKASAIFLASTMVLGNSAFVMAEDAVEQIAMTMEFSASETGADLLSSLAQTDLSWLKSAKIDANADVQETMVGVDFLAALNDTEIVSGSGYLNKETMEELVKIKQFGDQYFKVNTKEMMEEAGVPLGDALSADVVETPAIAEETMEAIQDPEFQGTLVQNYLLPLMGTVKMTSVEDQEVSYQDHSATISYTGVSANLNDLAGVVAGELETLKNDETTLSLINSAASEGELTAEMLDQIIQALNDAVEGGSLKDIDGKAMFGTSEDGNALGGYIAAEIGGEELKVADFVAFKDGDALVGEATVGTADENFSVIFNIAEQYNFVLAANHQGVVEINADVTPNKGLITVKPITDYEEAPLADFEGFELQISYEGEDNSGNAAIAVVYEDEALFTLSVAAEPGTAVEIPDLTGVEAIDISNEEAMQAWAETIDPTEIMENLISAGVPEELLAGEAAE